MCAASFESWATAVLLVSIAAVACSKDRRRSTLAASKSELRHGEPVVAVVDSGIRISRQTNLDPRWQKYGPGSSSDRPYEICALPGETVAFQIVVAAAEQSLNGITIDCTDFPVINAKTKNSCDVFLVHEIPMKRRSGGRYEHESLGWTSGSTPEAEIPPTTIADPLIPVALAPPWAPYPSRVDQQSLQGFWVDVRIPEAGQFPVTERGMVKVRAHDRLLASIPVSVAVGSVALPYASAKTMLYFDPAEITGRTGTRDSIDSYLQLIHRHRLSSVFPVTSRADVTKFFDYFTGALFSEVRGYVGPGLNRPADVIVVGIYGSMGEPNVQSVTHVDEILAELEHIGRRNAPGSCDIFLYAIDEQCNSPRGKHWRQALDASGSERLRRLPVGHTCSEPPDQQAVDLVMMGASAYSPALALRAQRAGKQVWVYNGDLPKTGSFLTDAPTLSLTANGWIQANHRIERWFYWESTFWNDDNRGGLGPYDPFATAETFHNRDGDHCNGDGVLVYPGRQLTYPEHDLGTSEVIPSIRLKQWRRGLQDAGYIELARRIDPTATGIVLRQVLQGALATTRFSRGVPWKGDAETLRKARRALFDIIARVPH
jgi:hypothetical protein